MDGNNQVSQFVMVPKSVFEYLQKSVETILERVENSNRGSSGQDEYITAQEFMDRAKICRATFDEKRANNEIKVIKRGRKLYLTSDSVRKYIEGK
ncbi:helix-turn-helix domain-containing protein [Reichenbachiella carrageenanivorans]|uniref:Helix-turn-helix domain-containing protein n=1 Tax=Reichenbachiella carrageenanivorans TaxID=2979869 RepID=A0ABY6D0Z3_9BACT|nr:helix-turn-helix domain-containing protein [Reichenbachiella carrageenanivorans]UXX79778.1 helix-turn-helix domain-containing protein [Reichenbachiella carrageenanivorans]